MRVNWLAYAYRMFDGYGRYSARLIQALEGAGVQVHAHFTGAASAPAWLQARWELDWSIPTISCLPPYYLHALPKHAGPHILLSMTEGSECPDGWAEQINRCRIDHLIVPCAHNADAFRRGGVQCPIHVVAGGTDPDEFALLSSPLRGDTGGMNKPYTFLALADRGDRKGWYEVYTAFYQAFGGKTTGDQDVRLLIKAHPTKNRFLDRIAGAGGLDKRIIFVREDYDEMADLYRQADCVALPSRSEGWGMPHREAAMMGLPVITQRYSGMDDGYTDEWAIVVAGGKEIKIAADEGSHIKGLYRLCDVNDLARAMRACYDDPAAAVAKGQQAAQWLRANQTWEISCRKLIDLMVQEGVFEPERVYA